MFSRDIWLILSYWNHCATLWSINTIIIWWIITTEFMISTLVHQTNIYISLISNLSFSLLQYLFFEKKKVIGYFISQLPFWSIECSWEYFFIRRSWQKKNVVFISRRICPKFGLKVNICFGNKSQWNELSDGLKVSFCNEHKRTRVGHNIINYF